MYTILDRCGGHRADRNFGKRSFPRDLGQNMNVKTSCGESLPLCTVGREESGGAEGTELMFSCFSLKTVDKYVSSK